MKIEKCPFCGGNPKIKGKKIARVACSCTARTYGKSEAEAIAAWNRRANPDVGNPISEPVTNADRIRSATDEALAHEMLFFVPSDFDRHYTGVAGGYYKTAEVAVQANLDWLQQPAKEDE